MRATPTRGEARDARPVHLLDRELHLPDADVVAGGWKVSKLLSRTSSRRSSGV